MIRPLAMASLAATFCLSATAWAQDDQPDFRTAFGGTMAAAMRGDWDAALPAAEAALPLAESPAERYRIRHVLTDINARLGHWEAAGRWSHEAANIIHDDPELSENLIVMASHMAAEEGRAAAMLEDETRVRDANARAVSDHPQSAPGWQAAGSRGAVHADGLSCDLLRDGFLRFDLYGGAHGAPACSYWNHSDIGIRVTQGAVFDSEIERLTADQDAATPLDIAGLVAPDGGRAAGFDLGPAFPGGPQQHAFVMDTGTQTLTVQYPADAEAEALAAANNF